MPTRPATDRDELITHLYREFHSRLRQVVRIRAGVSDWVAEDGCQEAWATLLRRPEIDPRDPRIRGWLVIAAERRARSRRDRAEVDLDAIAAWTAGPDVTERRDALVDARATLARLKPAERLALGLQAYGYDYREIAAMTGATRTAVNRRITEGRARARQLQA